MHLHFSICNSNQTCNYCIDGEKNCMKILKKYVNQELLYFDIIKMILRLIYLIGKFTLCRVILPGIKPCDLVTRTVTEKKCTRHHEVVK